MATTKTKAIVTNDAAVTKAIILDEKKIQANLTKVLVTLDKGFTALHKTVLIPMLQHVMKHGNYMVIDHIWLRIPDGVQKAAIKAWLSDDTLTNLYHRPVKLKSGEEVSAWRKPQGDKLRINIEAMEALPFWKHKSANALNEKNPFNFNASFAAWYRRARARLDDKNVKIKDGKREDMLSELLALRDFATTKLAIPAAKLGEAELTGKAKVVSQAADFIMNKNKAEAKKAKPVPAPAPVTGEALPVAA